MQTTNQLLTLERLLTLYKAGGATILIDFDKARAIAADENVVKLLNAMEASATAEKNLEALVKELS